MCLLCESEQEELICPTCMGEKSDDLGLMLYPDTILGSGPLQHALQEAVLSPGFDVAVRNSGRPLRDGLEGPGSDGDGERLADCHDRLMRQMGIPIVIDLYREIPLHEEETEALHTILEKILNDASPTNRELLLRAGTALWHHAMGMRDRFSSKNGKRASGTFHLALRLFMEAKSLRADDLTLRNIAITLHSLGDHRAALEYCEALSGREDPQLLLIKGKCLGALGRSEEALGCMESILARNPSPRVLDETGRVLFSLGRTGEALEAFDRALGTDPVSEDALLSKYHLLNHMHEDGDAHEYLAKLEALGVSPVRHPLPLPAAPARESHEDPMEELREEILLEMAGDETAQADGEMEYREDTEAERERIRKEKETEVQKMLEDERENLRAEMELEVKKAIELERQKMEAAKQLEFTRLMDAEKEIVEARKEIEARKARDAEEERLKLEKQNEMEMAIEAERVSLNNARRTLEAEREKFRTWTEKESDKISAHREELDLKEKELGEKHGLLKVMEDELNSMKEALAAAREDREEMHEGMEDELNAMKDALHAAREDKEEMHKELEDTRDHLRLLPSPGKVAETESPPPPVKPPVLDIVDISDNLNRDLQKALSSGNEHLAGKRYGDALVQYEKATKLAPKNLDAWLKKARVLEMLERFDESLKSYDRILELDNREEGAWKSKVSLLHKLGRFKEVLEAYESLAFLFPEQANRYRTERGKLLMGMGRHGEAVQCFITVIDKNPNEVDAQLFLGDSLMKLDRLDDAYKCFNKVAELDPKNAGAWYRRGLIQKKWGRWGAAIQFFNWALALKPGFTEAWMSKGDILKERGELKEALYHFDRVIETDPKNERAWYNKANTLWEMGRHDEAVRCVDSLLELSPKSRLATEIKALMMEKLESKKHERKKDENYLMKKALSLRKDGKQEDALRLFALVSKLNPRNELALLKTAEMFADEGKLKRALKKYSEVLVLNPKNEEALMGKALTYLRLEAFEEANMCFDLLLKANPWNESVQRFREETLKRMKERRDEPS